MRQSKESSASKGTVRTPAVAGTFYPSDKTTLRTMVDNFLHETKVESSDNVQAVIVPHAGYIFSGSTAAKAFARIAPSAKYQHIFLLGPSHRVAFDGASVNTAADYDATPLGKIKVANDIGEALIHADSTFRYLPQAHEKEHCLEVQLPFLQEQLQNVPPVIPIIIGTQDFEKLEHIARTLQPYFTSDNLFVISSDFSHYPSYENAMDVDKATGEAILSSSVDCFLDVLTENANRHIPNLYTCACGQCAIAVLLLMMEKRDDLHIEHLAYCNSGDSPHGGKEEVVGYHAFTVTYKKDRQVSDTALGENSSSSGKHPKPSSEVYDSAEHPFTLSSQEKGTLLNIARKSITNELLGISKKSYTEKELTPTLKMTCGAFVTLTLNGKLRGCIGNLIGTKPLYQLVSNMAKAAAFEDPRFYPLTPEELTTIHIEISVLSPLKEVHSIDEIQLGRDGVYLVKGSYGGTFLPQVATETHWTKEEFLGHCARDKAGLGWDGWKDATIYTYQAEVFEEEEK